MRVVAQNHQNAQAEGSSGELVGLTDEAGQQGSQRQAQVAEQQGADVVPGAAGGCQGSAVFGGLTNDGNQGGVGNVADVPDNVRSDGGDDDYHRGQHLIVADTDELEGVQEGNQPGQQDQPGAVTAPLFRLGAVQDAAVDPGQAGIDDGEDGVDETRDGGAESGQIRQEGHEVECLNVAHQVEACVANTEQILQGETQFLLLSFRGVLRVFHKNNLQAFLLIARGAKNTI